MAPKSRRRFLREAATSGLTATLALPASAKLVPHESRSVNTGTHAVPLHGEWVFKLDPQGIGESDGWHRRQTPDEGWTEVVVPHTWQIFPDTAEYHGVVWYRRDFYAGQAWSEQSTRVEFEAVYHSATVWLNGKPIGKHLRKGYTSFTLDLSPALKAGGTNTLVVKVDNSFDENMLPRGRSFDWTSDGGITRPVRLLVTPGTFIDRVDVDAQPNLASALAHLDVRVAVRNTAKETAQLGVTYRIFEEQSEELVLEKKNAVQASLSPESQETISLPGFTMERPHLWHFDHPHLYRLEVEIERGGEPVHSCSTIFGVRKIEVKGSGIYLNGERVWLMGVERMAGSNPNYGMAEPAAWIEHDHRDLSELNCMLTRVHWQQDKRVLDYCDRQGLLIQEEVPTWGPDTFKGMVNEPSPEIMENGLEQLREMIHRDRNHPSVFAWGVCNEINGQNPPAYRFAERMYEEAKKLDPNRLATYASNSLYKTPEKDVAGKMDFIEWNEYYESWHMGTVEDIKKNLEEIHRAFPDKPIVISEYGYCECTPDRTGGDARKIEILREHNQVYRRYDYVAGAIFFCYNDYRTHIGDKGIGALKQRVHGVVDLYGSRKPSFDALRQESSPIAELRVKPEGDLFAITVVTRKDLPAYALHGYRVRGIAFIEGDLPMEQRDGALPRLDPGERATVTLQFKIAKPARVKVEVLRPMGHSVFTTDWRA